jgi:hypothetical protein
VTQFICWVLFPAALGLVSLGCGWLLEWGSGRQLPEPLALPAGLAVVLVVAEVTTKLNATARFTTPAVVALALLGLLARRPWRRRPRIGGWPLAAALAVYLVYLAPVFLTGEPTFTGYVKLDDTATWMTMTDRVLSHGHDLSGLAPSTYSTTLGFYLTGGEPVGAMLPWGIGHQLVGQDLAWVFQPYLAFLGGMLALSLWPIIGPLVRARPLRAFVVFIAAQAALLYGYSLWGGIKEVAAAWLVALTVASVIPVIEAQARLRSFLPLAAATFAMLGVLGYGGAVWLALPLVAVAFGSIRIWVRRRARWQLAGLLVLGGLLAFGLIRGAQGFLKLNGSLTTSELGNLIHRLNPLQVYGIWPAGDFRIDPPSSSAVVYVLIGIVIVSLAIGLLVSWQARWWLPTLYLGTAIAGTVLVSVKGSPWVQGKAFATISPAALLVGLSGVMALLGSRSSPRADADLAPRRLNASPRAAVWGRRAVAVLGAAAIAFGVLWSNVAAYHHVTLAPYGQFKELSEIGQRFAGDGPAMVNEYQPYAVRHFLRNLDPESPSELRYRVIPLRGGSQLPKSGYADLDQFELAGLLVYRTIVTRTSPSASRPPAPYKLVFDGHWYQVWQRPTQLRRPVLEHLPLGNSIDPTAVPRCGQVLRLARAAGRRGLLAAVARPDPSIVGVPSPLPTGDTHAAFRTTAPGVYQVWLGGSFTRRVIAYVDGVRVGSSHEVINESGEWTPLGSIRLAAGAHRVTLSYGDATLYPGGGGPGGAGPELPVGPVALAPADQRLPVTYLSPGRADSLCGRSWDWVEALGPAR